MRVAWLRDQCVSIGSRRRSNKSVCEHSRNILAFVVGCTRVRTRMSLPSCRDRAANVCKRDWDMLLAAERASTRQELLEHTYCRSSIRGACPDTAYPEGSGLA